MSTNNGQRTTNKRIGILAIQGDFALHAKMLDRIGVPWKLVKHVADLQEVDGLILPGGESTTMLNVFADEGMDTAIRDFAAAGKPRAKAGATAAESAPGKRSDDRGRSARSDARRGGCDAEWGHHPGIEERKLPCA